MHESTSNTNDNNSSEFESFPDSLEFIFATQARLATGTQVMHEALIKQIGAVPSRVEGAAPLTTFNTVFGWERQPTPLEYLGFIELLLTENGVPDSPKIIVHYLDWVIYSIVDGVEPFQMAYHLLHAHRANIA